MRDLLMLNLQFTIYNFMMTQPIIAIDHLSKTYNSNGGAVGRAAGLNNWRAVWLLIERGAAWKNELALFRPIPEVLDADLASRRGSHQEIPEEMALSGLRTVAAVMKLPAGDRM